MQNYWLSEFKEKSGPDMVDPEDDSEDSEDSDSEESGNLTSRQQALYKVYEMTADEYGMFDKSTGPDGAHYASASKNPFKEQGLVCLNCSFYKNKACEIVIGKIEPEGICKFWIIPQDSIKK